MKIKAEIMIRKKFEAIRNILLRKEDLAKFNMRYRQEPEFYFYKRVMDVNLESKSIEDFLGSNYHIVDQ